MAYFISVSEANKETWQELNVQPEKMRWARNGPLLQKSSPEARKVKQRCNNSCIDTISTGTRCGVQSNTGYDVGVARGSRGVLSAVIRGFKFMCYTCEVGHHPAQRHTAGKTNLRGETVRMRQKPQNSSFSGPPHPPKGVILEKL